MKTIILKVKDYKSPGFLRSGSAILNPVLQEEDGKQTDLGDYLMTSNNSRRVGETLRAVRDKWEKEGYVAIGDWD